MESEKLQIMQTQISVACFPSVLRAVTQMTPVKSITHLTAALGLHSLETQTLTHMSLMTSLTTTTPCLS